MNPWEQIAPFNPVSSAPVPGAAFLRPKKVVDQNRKRIAVAAETGSAPAARFDTPAPPATVLALVETVASAFGTAPLKTRNDILDLAIAEQYLEWLQSGVVASADELQRVDSLKTKLDNIIAHAIAAKTLPKRPAQLVREILPALIDAFAKAKQLVDESLFVPPRCDAAVRNERTELEQRIQNLSERETKLLEESRWLESERQQCPLTGDAGKDAKSRERLAELDVKWKALCEKAAELNADEERFAEHIKGLEKKFPSGSGISLLDARRKSISKTFDPAQISAEEVAETLRNVKTLPLALDQKLTELEAKLPPPCRDAEGQSVNLRFWYFAKALATHDKTFDAKCLKEPDNYSMLYRGGQFYRDVKCELTDLVSSLEAIGAEYQTHQKAMNEIKELVRQGNVFLAEKRFKSVVPKFKEIRYQNVQGLIEESLRIHREAQRLAADAREFHAKNQGFFAKIFRDRNKQKELEQRLQAAQAKAAALPKSELKTQVSGLLLEAESKLKG